MKTVNPRPYFNVTCDKAIHRSSPDQWIGGRISETRDPTELAISHPLIKLIQARSVNGARTLRRPAADEWRRPGKLAKLHFYPFVTSWERIIGLTEYDWSAKWTIASLPSSQGGK